MHSKKGLFDIEDLFSFFVYILVLFVFLAILSLPQCSNRAVASITSDTRNVDILNSQQDVAEMLKTMLPDNLAQLIEAQSGKTYYSKVLTQYAAGETVSNAVESEEKKPIYDGLDKTQAISLLETNRDIYLGKTYAEFIDGLQFIAATESRRNNLFGVVTRAMFLKSAYPVQVIDLNPQLNELTVYPEVYVKFGIAGKFDSGDADLKNPTPETAELTTSFTGVSYRRPAAGDAYAIIPLADSSLNPRTATIKLVARKGSGGLT